MTLKERIELARKCSNCKYSVFVWMREVEEGEYEPEFGRTECCSRTVTKKVLICKLIPCICEEVEECPKKGMTDKQIEEKLEEFDNWDYA